MIRHIEFCLEEIECELDAQGMDGLFVDEQEALRNQIAKMRSTLAECRERRTQCAAVAIAEQGPEGVDCDDLTLIRGIDDASSILLREMSVTRFDTISKWSADDVARIAAGLGSHGQISEQNWIEQAAILASGELTHHARRVRRGEFKCLVREADEADPPSEVGPIVPASTVSSDKEMVVEAAPGSLKTANPVVLSEEIEVVAPPIARSKPIDVVPSGNIVQFNLHAPLPSRRIGHRMVASLLLAVLVAATVYTVRSPTFAALAQIHDPD